MVPWLKKIIVSKANQDLTDIMRSLADWNWKPSPTVHISPHHNESPLHKESYAPIILATLSTAFILYMLQEKINTRGTFRRKHLDENLRSTTLPGFGILGDRVNELIEIFLDGLAIYVHNDRNWDCQRKLLCEANQRSIEYGIFHAILMYFTSLSVSFLLRDQRVSESMEAMKRGRQGKDCTANYPQCPF